MPCVAVTHELRAFIGLLPYAGLLGLGCASASNFESGADSELSVIDGDPSPESQNAVVAVVNREHQVCTGALVAPTLVLTARHCIFPLPVADDELLSCVNPLDAPLNQVTDPAHYSVYVGVQAPFDPVVAVKRFYSGPELDLCSDDIALLELASPLAIEPLPVRLDNRPEEREWGTLVGYGRTEQQIDLTRRQTAAIGPRAQLDVRISKVGPDSLMLAGGGVFPVPPGWFVTSQAGCYGDSGGPLIAKSSGAIIGVVSASLQQDPVPTGTVGDCIESHTIFRTLFAQQAWLRDAFADAGQTPWLEGFARPASAGEACQADAECNSGICLGTNSARFCSKRCDGSACPMDMQCIGNEGQRFCVPARLSGQTAGGCSFAQAAGWRCPFGVFLGLSLALLIRRRPFSPIPAIAITAMEKKS